MERDSLPNLDLKLLDTYVGSKITDNNKQPMKQNLENYLTQWITETGQYGQSKTTDALIFSYNLILQYEQQPKEGILRIPIFLELRGNKEK